MEFRILGPVEVADGCRLHTPSARKPRMLLASLLVRPGTVVPAESLVDGLWAAAPPRTARTALQVYVSRLRAMLAAAGPGGPDRRCELLTQPAGYVLQLGDSELDAREFERLCQQAREAQAQGAMATASGLLADALALWRGPALSDVRTGPLLETAATVLDEARMAALERRIELDLSLGRHADLVGELYAMVAEHPLRESLHRHLMLALHRSGRQADALRGYADIRRTLVEELGMEPGRDLQQLHRAILRHDVSLDVREPAALCSPA